MMVYTKSGKTLRYEIRRKKIKHTYLRLKNDVVVISTPNHTKEPYLLSLLDTHFDRFFQAANRLKLEEGSMLLWGIVRKIDIVVSKTFSYELNETTITLYAPPNLLKETMLENVYQSETIRHVHAHEVAMKAHIANHGLTFRQIAVKPMTSRYGSCSYYTKNISINRYLSKLDPIYINYVLYHEFAHLRHPNHSKAYHDFLRVLFPQAPEVRKSLKKQRIS